MKKSFQHIIWFAVAGGAGFLVDAGILQALSSIFDMSPVAARVPSFLLAVATTWYINSRQTFKGNRDGSKRQMGEYLLAMILGGTVNWIAYLIFLQAMPLTEEWPALALVPATATSMMFNYAAMRFHIFRRDDNAS